MMSGGFCKCPQAWAAEKGEMSGVVDVQSNLRSKYMATGIFPVKVEKDGGRDGTGTTSASWTYTVRQPDGDEAIGRNMPVKTLRPHGGMSHGNHGQA